VILKLLSFMRSKALWSCLRHIHLIGYSEFQVSILHIDEGINIHHV